MSMSESFTWCRRYIENAPLKKLRWLSAYDFFTIYNIQIGWLFRVKVSYVYHLYVRSALCRAWSWTIHDWGGSSWLHILREHQHGCVYIIYIFTLSYLTISSVFLDTLDAHTSTSIQAQKSFGLHGSGDRVDGESESKSSSHNIPL